MEILVQLISAKSMRVGDRRSVPHREVQAGMELLEAVKSHFRALPDLADLEYLESGSVTVPVQVGFTLDQSPIATRYSI
jgi:hypothetical protein